MQETIADQGASPPKTGLLRAAFAPRRVLLNALLIVYCAALYAVFDFAYSKLTRGQERAARVYDAVYDHGFVPKFDGDDIWGGVRYRLITDSLGFKDASTRDVPLQSDTRRILLIGDSFAEGIGFPFEKTFAGLLNQAGLSRPEKVEFLDAGVASYSPSIYYKKIKYLMDRGLKFDEVVLLSDTSDVEDEATAYFCIDDDPKYHRFCTTPPGERPEPAIKRDFFIDHFVITNRLRVAIARWFQIRSGDRRAAIANDHNRIGWIGNPDPARYAPLGVDGGIARSLENMGKLSDLLASRGIPLTIVVYPWAQQIAQGDRDSRQEKLWRDFCPGRCKAFIDLFPAFFAVADREKGWYEHLYILGDDHFSADGNRMLYEELARRILP